MIQQVKQAPRGQWRALPVAREAGGGFEPGLNECPTKCALWNPSPKWSSNSGAVRQRRGEERRQSSLSERMEARRELRRGGLVLGWRFSGVTHTQSMSLMLAATSLADGTSSQKRIETAAVSTRKMGYSLPKPHTIFSTKLRHIVGPTPMPWQKTRGNRPPGEAAGRGALLFFTQSSEGLGGRYQYSVLPAR